MCGDLPSLGLRRLEWRVLGATFGRCALLAIRPGHPKLTRTCIEQHWQTATSGACVHWVQKDFRRPKQKQKIITRTLVWTDKRLLKRLARMLCWVQNDVQTAETKQNHKKTCVNKSGYQWEVTFQMANTRTHTHTHTRKPAWTKWTIEVSVCRNKLLKVCDPPIVISP